MSNELTKKIGNEFKEAREKKGLTYKEIYAQIRIDEKYLEAIENGNFSLLPEVYVRAFIREFASEIDLNPEEMIKKYELAIKGKDFDETLRDEESVSGSAVTEETPKTSFVDVKEKGSTQSKKKQNPLIYYIIGGVLGLIIILYFVLSGGKGEEIVIEKKYEVTRQTEIEENTVKNNETSIPVKEKEKNIVEQNIPPVNPFKLKFTVIDTVWIRAKIDDSKTEEFTLFPEISRTIEVENVANVLIGNSGGVEIYIDGNKLDFKGEKGKVRNLILTKSGIKKRKIQSIEK